MVKMEEADDALRSLPPGEDGPAARRYCQLCWEGRQSTGYLKSRQLDERIEHVSLLSFTFKELS